MYQTCLAHAFPPAPPPIHNPHPNPQTPTQVMSLAQGIVHWQPPPAAMQAAADLLAAGGPSVNGYGPAEGLPALREALRHKLATKNGLQGVSPVGCLRVDGAWLKAMRGRL